MMKWLLKKENKSWLIYGFIIIIGVVLLILPADFFDNGHSVCVSVLLMNKQCYACGLTRGIMHLIHLDFEAAWEYNILCFIVFPLLVGLIGNEFYKFITGEKSKGNFTKQ